MSNNIQPEIIIPQQLDDRLTFLRSEWRKYRKMREKANQGFKPLKELVYFLVTVDHQKPVEIARLLGVVQSRINTIIDEFDKKGGENT